MNTTYMYQSPCCMYVYNMYSSLLQRWGAPETPQLHLPIRVSRVIPDNVATGLGKHSSTTAVLRTMDHTILGRSWAPRAPKMQPHQDGTNLQEPIIAGTTI